MKITVYTITDCKFSQAEKQYLQSKQIQFEEKNLEANREYLTEMLNISNNFAGTPVTKIEKDDGQIIVLKGFTQDEFDKALAVDPNAPKQQIAPPVSQPAAPDAAASMPMPQEQLTTPSVAQAMPTPPINTQPDMNAMPPAQPTQPMQAAQPMSPQPPAPIPVQIQTQDAPPFNTQPDMNVMPPTQPPQPMQAPQPPVNTMYAPPVPPSNPAGDQALNSVLQNLQNRSGDGTQ